MRNIGQYEIHELLGEGGIGQVHAALDTVLNREVAIKSLRPELLSDQTFSERFRAEATSLARLNHTNITTLFSLLPEGNNLYMVMERVRGHTLDEILKKRNSPIPVRESLAIIAQAADGLAYAHSMGVIHRDIKPANLMFTESGLLKIMDFGIARVRGSQRLTRDGSIVGTLAYMAPEQLRGEEGDERSDIYSLAIVLYEMLCGATPFKANSDYDLMQAQMNSRPERLGPRVPGLEPRVESAMMKALAKKPEQRFATVKAFSDALGATALRHDAVKILHDATRLIEQPGDAQAAPAPVPDKKARMPAAVRIPAIVGGIALVVAAGVVFGVPALRSMTASKPARPPVAETVPAKPTPPPVAEAPEPPKPAPAPAPTPAAQDQPSKPIGGGDAPPPKDTPAPTPVAETPPTLADLQAAMEQKDFAKAFEIARKLAASGNADAQAILGLLYANGQGTQRDDQQAVYWYGKAAEQGNARAQQLLGGMYENGRGVSQNDTLAFFWYRKAAEQGDATAQNDLGYMYSAGRGVNRDDKQAVFWYRKSADQGNPKAQKNLGDMYANGRGVARDDAEAVRWYLLAAEQGFVDAMVNLGYFYANGRGVPRDVKQAAMWYRRAADRGSIQAQEQLDKLRARGDITD
jgi:serine/threonine-protein kinase